MAKHDPATIALIKEHEGSIPHMYLDTAGLVTVGVGQLLRTVEAAKALTFVDRESKAPATPEQIETDFNNVSQQQPGLLASSYKEFTKLDMTEEAVDALLEQRVDEFEAGLAEDFPGYADFPQSAREGLLDMIFNLGRRGLATKFPTFSKAAREQDWATCAKECRRRGISNARNQKTREFYEQATQA